MMGQLDLGSEESEDQFMKMMQGMMSTLLSKDVLYPSLVELRKQVRTSRGGWVGGAQETDQDKQRWVELRKQVRTSRGGWGGWSSGKRSGQAEVGGAQETGQDKQRWVELSKQIRTSSGGWSSENRSGQAEVGGAQKTDQDKQRWVGWVELRKQVRTSRNGVQGTKHRWGWGS